MYNEGTRRPGKDRSNLSLHHNMQLPECTALRADMQLPECTPDVNKGATEGPPRAHLHHVAAVAVEGGHECLGSRLPAAAAAAAAAAARPAAAAARPARSALTGQRSPDEAIVVALECHQVPDVQDALRGEGIPAGWAQRSELGSSMCAVPSGRAGGLLLLERRAALRRAHILSLAGASLPRVPVAFAWGAGCCLP